MRAMRDIKYENLPTNYSYGSLAEDIWKIAEQEEAVPQPKKSGKKRRLKWNFFKRAKKPLVEDVRRVRPKWNPNYMSRLLKYASFCGFILVIFTYFSCVLLGHMAIETQTKLVAMQHAEAQLINEINEMQIAVEQLKGPERIREIASRDLDMVVATDNVYVNAAKVQTVGEHYRGAGVAEKDTFWAWAK